MNQVVCGNKQSWPSLRKSAICTERLKGKLEESFLKRDTIKADNMMKMIYFM
jgi:hypothetical protein